VSKRTRIWIGLCVTVFAVLAVTVAVGTRPAPEATDRPTIAPVGVMDPSADGTPGREYYTGCIEDPEACEEVRQSLPVGQRCWEDTPAGKAFGVADVDGDVLLSDAAKLLLGRHLPARDQGNVGSCVGFGTVAAIEYLMIAQAVAEGFGPDAIRDLSQEVVYAGSRVEIGKGRIRGDGSVGSWAAKFTTEYGVVCRDVHGPFDLRRYSSDRCREWGRTGVPDPLEPVARLTPVKAFTFVRSAKDAAAAVRQRYTISVGSRRGFGDRMPLTRDSDGFLSPRGDWGHCMAVIGVIGGRRPGFLFTNSWGDRWVNGPTGGRDIPPGSFFVDWQVADGMFREGDAIAFSDVADFPTRPLWFVQANRPLQIARGGK
jgi:hypothetical protein